jgi:hypothetical protein
VDAFFRTSALRYFAEPFDDTFFLEVDRNCARRLRHGQTLRHAIDGDHLLGAMQCSAVNHLLPDGPCARGRLTDNLGELARIELAYVLKRFSSRVNA